MGQSACMVRQQTVEQINYQSFRMGEKPQINKLAPIINLVSQPDSPILMSEEPPQQKQSEDTSDQNHINVNHSIEAENSKQWIQNKFLEQPQDSGIGSKKSILKKNSSKRDLSPTSPVNGKGDLSSDSPKSQRRVHFNSKQQVISIYSNFRKEK
ncbi:hypothetical protein pb186bvf_019908 [Paramecium bursaria]